jgi:hypothetical protein
MAVTGGRKDVMAGMRNPKDKAPFGEYAMAAQAGWATWGRWLPVGEVCRRGWAGPDPRRRFKGKFDFRISNDLGFLQDFEKFCKEI